MLFKKKKLFALFYARYLYCDEIQLEADNVLATLYVAKKYIVPHLARACVNYLETSLTAKNACLLLSQSRLFEEPELMQRCWEVIDAQVCESLNSSSNVFDNVLSKVTKIENIISSNDELKSKFNDDQKCDLCTTIPSLLSSDIIISSPAVLTQSPSLTSININF